MADKDDTKSKDEEVVLADPTQQPPEEPEEETLAEEPPEPKKEEPEAPAEEPEEPKGEEQAPPSRREQLRIHDLLKKYGPPKPQEAQTPQGALDYGKALDADPEIIKQLEADRQAAIHSAVDENQAQLQTYRWETMVNLDNPQVESKYPQLDKNSPDFNPALSNAIGQMYFQVSGVTTYPDGTYTVSTPGIRYKDYVESIFELGNEIAGAKTADTTKNIAKQSAQTGLRPDGSSAKRLNLNKDPKDMTMEELYAASGLPDTRPKK